MGPRRDALLESKEEHGVRFRGGPEPHQYDHHLDVQRHECHEVSRGIPTYYWCAEGRQELLLEGLKRGVDVNYASAPGITLLMEAALAGDARMIALSRRRSRWCGA